MFNLEYMSKRLGTKIASELKLDDSSRDVVSYGIFAIIQMVFNIVLVIIFGLICGIVIEALIASFAISILRKSSGGVHAKSTEICAAIGTVVAIVIGLISKVKLNLETVIISEAIIFILAYYIIIKLAPVDSERKPIKTDKKRQRLKNASISTLSIYLIVVMINNICYYYTDIYILNSYSICILGGIAWQILSLTKLGHRFMKLVEAFL